MAVLKLAGIGILGLTSSLAFAGAEETPQADQGKPEVVAASSSAIAMGSMESRLPPGFKSKKRGKFLVYCKTDTPIGTRFKKETCLDDAQMRDYLIWMQENKAEVDRIRQTCSNKRACGQPDA